MDCRGTTSYASPPKDAVRPLKGKILPVNYSNRSVDKLYEELPEELRARKAGGG